MYPPSGRDTTLELESRDPPALFLGGGRRRKPRQIPVLLIDLGLGEGKAKKEARDVLVVVILLEKDTGPTDVREY